MTQIIVIGAGPSGLTAAIAAARQGASVTVLEKMEKPGRKLLITGNGRCNLTNTLPAEAAYRGADQAFVRQVLGRFGVQDTMDFFHGLGLLTRERAGYVYPYTDQAGSVLELLLLELRRLKVKMKYNENVRQILRTDEGFKVRTDTWSYPCSKVILCAGGKAAPQTGSDGSGYELVLSCGHSLTPIYPALVPLKAEGPLPRMLSGTRTQAALALEIDGRICCRETGELQWTDYGVSGIVVFQLSRFLPAALSEKKRPVLHIDQMPEYSRDELVEMLARRRSLCPEQGAEELLAGFMKKKTIAAFVKLTGKKVCQERGQAFADAAAAFLKDLTVTVTGTKDFDMAQVCAGGVPEKEVSPETLESRKMPGLYLAGELLDVDGICGGYNLQWAWSSGYTAGSSAAAALGA